PGTIKIVGEVDGMDLGEVGRYTKFRAGGDIKVSDGGSREQISFSTLHSNYEEMAAGDGINRWKGSEGRGIGYGLFCLSQPYCSSLTEEG
ncbi:hypothetical protein KI387_042654, partial [Taxus chinensis]